MRGEGWIVKGTERPRIKWREKMPSDDYVKTAEKIIDLLKRQRSSSLDDIKSLAICMIALVMAAPGDKAQLAKDVVAELRRALDEELAAKGE